MLLDRGADPDVQDHRGYTPLHASVKFTNNLSTFTLLLQRGARPRIRDNEGKQLRTL
jgi:ankyrin repeat protein